MITKILQYFFLLIIISKVKGQEDCGCVYANETDKIDDSSRCTSVTNCMYENKSIDCCYLKVDGKGSCISVDNETYALEQRIKILKLMHGDVDITIDCRGSFIFLTLIFFILSVLNLI